MSKNAKMSEQNWCKSIRTVNKILIIFSKKQKLIIRISAFARITLNRQFGNKVRSNLAELPEKTNKMGGRQFLMVAQRNCNTFCRNFFHLLVAVRGTTFTLIDVNLSRKSRMNLNN